jgi:hypothetical protein
MWENASAVPKVLKVSAGLEKQSFQALEPSSWKADGDDTRYKLISAYPANEAGSLNLEVATGRLHAPTTTAVIPRILRWFADMSSTNLPTGLTRDGD